MTGSATATAINMQFKRRRRSSSGSRAEIMCAKHPREQQSEFIACKSALHAHTHIQTERRMQRARARRCLHSCACALSWVTCAAADVALLHSFSNRRCCCRCLRLLPSRLSLLPQPNCLCCCYRTASAFAALTTLSAISAVTAFAALTALAALAAFTSLCCLCLCCPHSCAASAFAAAAAVFCFLST